MELSGDRKRESNTLLGKEDAYVIRGCSPVYAIPYKVGNENGFLCEKISFRLYQILCFSIGIKILGVSLHTRSPMRVYLCTFDDIHMPIYTNKTFEEMLFSCFVPSLKRASYD